MVKTFDICSPAALGCPARALKTFSLTTAIDHVNGSRTWVMLMKKVLTDVIAHVRRLMGDEVCFLTDTDEQLIPDRNFLFTAATGEV